MRPLERGSAEMAMLILFITYPPATWCSGSAKPTDPPAPEWPNACRPPNGANADADQKPSAIVDSTSMPGNDNTWSAPAVCSVRA